MFPYSEIVVAHSVVRTCSLLGIIFMQALAYWNVNNDKWPLQLLVSFEARKFLRSTDAAKVVFMVYDPA